MKEHDLARLDLRQGDDRIQLQRGSLSVEPAAVMQPIATATAGAAKPAEASSPPPVEDDRNIAFIKSIKLRKNLKKGCFTASIFS